MKTILDLSSLSHAELVALVQDLQDRLIEREQQIEELQTQLGKRTAAQPVSMTVPSGVEEQPAPGSQEDLLAQLEKIYPKN